MDAPFTMPVSTFWAWLIRHNNCILRAACPEASLFDDESFHWHFAGETDGIQVVQVVQGKRLIGELFIETEKVAYVQAVPSENGQEHTFELISETETERTAAYVFVMVHPYGEDLPASESGIH